jgi:hypothetical protein
VADVIIFVASIDGSCRTRQSLDVRPHCFCSTIIVDNYYHWTGLSACVKTIYRSPI